MPEQAPFGQDAETKRRDADKMVRNGGLMAGAGVLITLASAAVGQVIVYTPVFVIAGIALVAWGVYQKGRIGS